MSGYCGGKVALITGGARGLGQGLGRLVLENGGKLAIVDLLDTGADTAKEFNQQFGEGSSIFIKCDVSNREELANAFRKTKEEFGKIDIVVNNAGITGGLDGLDNPDWQRVIDINLVAVVQGSILARDYMSTAGDGKGGILVNMASFAGLWAGDIDPIYRTTKHGVVGLTKSLSATFERVGIRVGCLCPTFVKTDMVTGLFKNTQQDHKVAGLTHRIESIGGFIEVSEVVEAFRRFLDDTEKGPVIAVTPLGIETVPECDIARRLKEQFEK